MAHVWNVSTLDYELNMDGRTNVVTTVHWRVSQEDAEGNTGSSYGTQALAAPGETFVEWADITEAIAIGWAKDAMGQDAVDAIEAGCDAQVAEKANPTSGSGVPW
jgi:hypothetical protein